MKCYYCPTEDDEMYQVKAAVKPPYHSFRWKLIGFCCENCYAQGKPVLIEYTPQVTVTHAQQVQPKEV